MPFTGGSEFRVNGFTDGTQTTSSTNVFAGTNPRSMQSLAMDDNGNLIVTWSSQGQDDPTQPVFYGIYARRYDAATATWGSPFLVNTVTSENQVASSVATNANGEFVITWASNSFNQTEDLNYGIYAQRYNSAGAVGSPFLVNVTTSQNQEDASVAMDPSGGFVVTWTSRSQDGDGRGVYARRYSAAGVPVTGEILVNTFTTNDQFHSSVATDANGNFVVVWESFGQDGSLLGVYGQRFTAAGAKAGTEFLVNTGGTVNDQRDPKVSMDATGNFVVTWTSNDQGLPGFEVYAQRYDSAGNALGSAIKVNQTSTGAQQYSDVKMLKTGGFIITWTSTDASGTGIYGRRFGANGLPLAGADGNEFLINATTAGNQNFSSVGVDGNGNFAVAWTSEQSDAGDIYSRIFSVVNLPNNPPTNITLSNDTLAENVADNTVVGTFATTDPDDATNTGAYTYEFIAGTGDTDNAAFTIAANPTDPTKFDLRIRQSPDFETKPSYSIRIRTTDAGGLSFEKVLPITITNLNEAPTALALSVNQVNENVPANTLIGTFATTDPDANNTFIYSLIAGSGDTDNGSFTISGNELRINASPNFEVKPTYTVRVRTTDQNGLSLERSFTINVVDLNDQPTDITLSRADIDENAPANSVIGTLTTVDPDISVNPANDTFTYQLLPGVPDNAFFTIVNNQLQINISPDFEIKPTYAIRIRTIDKGGLIFDKDFTIRINDLFDPPSNQAPTDVNISPSAVNENVAAGTVIGTFATTDPNAGDTFAYALVGGVGSTDNGSFAIVNGQLQILTTPDFEVKPSYSIRVRTTDAGGLSFEKQLVITINNLNEAPTNILLTPDNVNENVAIGTPVGILSAIDPDQGDTFTYQLVAGAGSADNAAFTLTPAGALSINVSPNFELKAAYNIRVQVRDAQGAVFEKALVVNINDQPEAGSPTDLTLSNSDIAENSPANSVIGALITTDNSAGPFTYTLDTAFGDGNLFTINASNQLVLVPSPNFETKPSYNVRIRTTDPDGLSLTKVLTVNVTDVNEAPTDLALNTTTIDENVPADSVVGLFSATDPDLTEAFTYTLVTGPGATDNGAFRIVNNELRIINVPNFETKSTYNIRVRVTDKGGLPVEKALTLTVRDLGERPTDISLSAAAVDENVPANSLIGTLSTVDPDIGDTFTYALASGTGDTDNGAFTIVNNQLRIVASPNFETKPSYSVRVRTTDRDGLTFEKPFIITVRNINEPPLDIGLSASTIDENVPAGSLVGTLTAVDSDTGDTFTYSLIAGSGSTDNAAFSIVNNELRINASPDFETKPSYSIRVQARDASGLTVQRIFTIGINNLPETPGTTPPQDLLLSNAIVNENVPPTTVIGAFSTVDPDVGDTFTYSLVTGAGSTDNAAFTIVGNQLQINNFPDFETKPSYSIRVRTTDSGNRSFDKVFTITVNNLPETPGTTLPRDILLSNAAVDENNLPNALVGTLSTVDPDVGDTFTYQLVAGTGAADNAAFTIVNNELRLNASADFETKSSYSIRIRTTDRGNLSFDKIFTIAVNNLPELPGTTPPRDLLLSNSRVNENLPVGSIVGLLSTVDPDVGDTFTYSLVSGAGSTDNAAFTIVGDELRLNVSPDFETKSSYSIRVRTQDVGNLAVEKTFTITVVDLPETPGTTPPRDLLLSNSRIDENRPANSLVGNFTTVDPDVGDSFTYSLVAGTGSTDNAAFTIVGNQLRLNSSADFEVKPTYSIRVRTQDVGNLAFEKVFTVSVNDLPERPGDTTPTDLLLSKTTVDENVPVGTVVGTLSTVDPDVGDTFIYTLAAGFGDNILFQIVGNQLRINVSPDFETKPSYSLRVTTTDSGGRALTKDLTVTVINGNDPPVVTPSAGSLVYREGAGAVAIDAAVTVTDIDSPNLTGATVRIVGFVPGQDELAIQPPTGITSNFDAATGVLTLTGSASLAVYQQALRTITYNNRSTNPSTATRTLQFTARDESLTSRIGTRTIQILATDSPPVVTTSTGNLAYQEGAGEVAVDAGVLVNDSDSPTLTGATVRILNYVAGQDQLRINVPTGITSNFDAATGTLTLAGAVSPAIYQAALRSVTYVNTSGSPNVTPRTVQFSVRDTTASSNLATRTIALTAIDSPPTVNPSSGNLSYREDAGAVPIDPQIQIADPDSANLTGATVSLIGYLGGQDSLSVQTQSGITSNFDAATGVLTLTGAAPVATYQAVLRTVAYTNRIQNPNPAARSAQFSVRDSASTSNLATRGIQVLPINDAPTLQLSRTEVSLASGSIAVDPRLVLIDVDSANLTGVTVTIGGYIRGEDNLLFTSQSGITGSFDSAAGVLRLTGAATPAVYQTALRSVRYVNNRAIPTGTPRLLTVQATDGIASSPAATGQITVKFAPSGEIPGIDLNGTGVGVDYSQTFVMSGPPINVVASDARFTNQAYPVLTSARVVIANPLNGAAETLSAETAGMGITAAYDPASGTLNLTGAASLSNYLQVLRSVQYNNTSPTIDTTTRTLLFTVSNGQTTSTPAQTRVQVSQIKLASTIGADGTIFTTPATDVIDAASSDDSVVSILANLQQNDTIQGGPGRDTLTLQDGTGTATIAVDNLVNQISGILTGNTTVTGFEVFNLSGFGGTAIMIGSDQGDDTLVAGQGNDMLMGQAGNDVLNGNPGNDQLDGGSGNDQLEGGLGDDLYILDSPNDLVIERPNEGFDTIQALFNLTLPANVEALILTGSATTGTGNALDNRITGNGAANQLRGEAGNDVLTGSTGRDQLTGGSGNDRLIGEQGRDVLTGNKGRDRFVLTSARGNSRDTIRDFRSPDDTIEVIRNSFSETLRLGRISASQFRLGTAAIDSSDRFIYNRQSGALFFDADGVGGTAQVEVARLSNKSALNRSDLVVVGS